MSSPVMHGDGMLFRNPVEIVNRELATIFYFRVVKEIAFDPITRRSLGSTGTQLCQNTVNRYELDFEWIACEDLVKQDRSASVIVGVDETRDNSCTRGVPVDTPGRTRSRISAFDPTAVNVPFATANALARGFGESR